MSNHLDLVLVWVQTVYKDNQQMTKVAASRERVKRAQTTLLLTLTSVVFPSVITDRLSLGMDTITFLSTFFTDTTVPSS